MTQCGRYISVILHFKDLFLKTDDDTDYKKGNNRRRINSFKPGVPFMGHRQTA